MTIEEPKAEIDVEFDALRQLVDEIEWDRIGEGLEQVARVFNEFQAVIQAHLSVL